MGFYFLYSLLLILAPLALGVALALGLRELYAKNPFSVEYAAGVTSVAAADEDSPETPAENASIEDEGAEEMAGVEMTTIKPPLDSPHDVSAAETADEAAEATTETGSENAEPSEQTGAENSDVGRPAENSATDSAMLGDAAQSVFDDASLRANAIKIDSAIEEMLDEKDTVVPSDLSAQLEKGYADLDGQFDDVEDIEMDDEVLARALESGGGLTEQDGTEHLELSEPEFAGAESGSSPISSTAKEVLGDDFDFNSLLPDTEFAEEPSDSSHIPSSSPPPASTPLVDLGDGIYRAETLDATALPESSSLQEYLLPTQQEIASFFPEEMLMEAVVEPDRSASATKYSVVEESRPMLVRKHREKTK